jgi:hypothetical protein
MRSLSSVPGQMAEQFPPGIFVQKKASFRWPDLLNFYDNFTRVLTGKLMPKCVLQFPERQNFINYGTYIRGFKGANHLFLMLTTSNGDAPYG